MSIYANCVEQGVYTVNQCDVKEGARVRTIRLLDKTESISDPSDSAEWDSLVTAGKAIVIPRVRGNYDGGAVSESAGFGDEATEFTGRIHTLTYFDPNLSKDNTDYYNKLTKNSKNYKLFYETESLIWETASTPAISAKSAVSENTTDQVTYEVMVKWSNENMPVQYDRPV